MRASLSRALQLLSILIIASLAPAISLASTEIFDGEVLSGDNVEVDDFTFIITMNKYANAIFVNGGTIFQSVPIFKCEDMESFVICFKNTSFDEEENVLYALVSINRSKPELSVTKEINDTDMFIGEEALVKLTVRNSGDVAPEIILTDDYPTTVEISEIEGGCRQHENQVYWQGHLEKNEERKCQFIIKGIGETHRSVAAHLKYWNGFRYIDEYTSAAQLDIDPALEMNALIVREDYEVDGSSINLEDENPEIYVGEVSRLVLNISSQINDEAEAKIRIILPANLQYMSTGDLRFVFKNASGNRTSVVWSSERITRIDERTLEWSGRLKNKSSELFILKIWNKQSGKQNIVINTDYYIDDINYPQKNYESYDVIDPGLAVRMTIYDPELLFSVPERLDYEDNSIDLEAMHPYKFTVYVQNLNKFAKLESVTIKALTAIAQLPAKQYNSIEKEGQTIPYSLTLIPPWVAATQDFKTNISIKYTNEFGEQRDNSTEFILTVVPTKSLSIDTESSEGFILDGGEETEIKTKITNDRLVEINSLEVRDELPGIDIEGVHSNKLKLNPESTTEVYTYRIKAPILHQKTYYNITTTVSFFDNDLKNRTTISKNTTLTILPFRPELSIDLNLDTPEKIVPGTLIPVEYNIENLEEFESITDISIIPALSPQYDIIGVKNISADSLKPGEKITLKGIIQIRPKVSGTIKINYSVAEYSDAYGNRFQENSTEESMDVDPERISGPALFTYTSVPEYALAGKAAAITVSVLNNGSEAASATIMQGDKVLTIEVPPGETKTAGYTLTYSNPGNYSIPEAYTTYSFQGLNAYTVGPGATIRVFESEEKATANVTAENATVEPAVKTEIPEKEEMSLEEYEQLIKAKEREKIKGFAYIAIAAIAVMLIVLVYIQYAKSKGPSEPFIKG